MSEPFSRRCHAGDPWDDSACFALSLTGNSQAQYGLDLPTVTLSEIHNFAFGSSSAPNVDLGGGEGKGLFLQSGNPLNSSKTLSDCLVKSQVAGMVR